jgi:hypothetical protein
MLTAVSWFGDSILQLRSVLLSKALTNRLDERRGLFITPILLMKRESQAPKFFRVQLWLIGSPMGFWQTYLTEN